MNHPCTECSTATNALGRVKPCGLYPCGKLIRYLNESAHAQDRGHETIDTPFAPYYKGNPPCCHFCRRDKPETYDACVKPCEKYLHWLDIQRPVTHPVTAESQKPEPD